MKQIEGARAMLVHVDARDARDASRKGLGKVKRMMVLCWLKTPRLATGVECWRLLLSGIRVLVM